MTVPEVQQMGNPLQQTPRDRAKQLMQERDLIQSEIQQHQQTLQTNGDVGMTGPLVDAQGFPRADIDVVAVRNARVRIIESTNDHQRLSNRIQEALNDVFATVEEPRQLREDGPRANLPSAGAVAQNFETVLAKVDAVYPDGPADRAGVKRDDLIVSIASVDRSIDTSSSSLQSSAAFLQMINEIVMENIDRELKVIIRRRQEAATDGTDSDVALTVVPTRNWPGRGLLGCHIVPYRS